jgi:hypothetical protein
MDSATTWLTALPAGAVVAFMLLGVLLVILWIALPLAIFGTKPILRKLLYEMQRTNDLLEQGLRLEQAPHPGVPEKALNDAPKPAVWRSGRTPTG